MRATTRLTHAAPRHQGDGRGRAVDRLWRVRRPKLKKIASQFYIDDAEPGRPSPRLYWMRNGKRLIVDRQIVDYGSAACIIYETTLPSLSRVVFAMLPEKSPVPIVASDSADGAELSRLVEGAITRRRGATRQ